jgi:hypothetical protein
MHDHLHGFIVIPLDFEVGDLAVALGSGNPGVPQEILDGGQVRIGI